MKQSLLSLILCTYAQLGAMSVESQDMPLHEDEESSLTRSLVLACQNGETTKVTALITSHPSLIKKTSALHKACQFGQAPIVQLLLAQNASPNQRGHGGTTPLLAAATNGQLSCVQILVAANATIQGTDDEGWTALHVACRFGHLAVVEFLLAKKITLSATLQQVTPLHLAVKYGHAKIAALLIVYGSSCNAKTSDGLTPLHSACLEGNRRLLLLLMYHGASIDEVTNNGWTALHCACKGGDLALVHHIVTTRKALLTHKPTENSSYANQDVTTLLNKKTIIDPKAHDGSTPLHIASAEGHIHIVQYLLQAGAYVKAQTLAHETPRDKAQQKNQSEIVQLLNEIIDQ